MATGDPILVTGAAGNVGGVGRTVVELLRQRNLPVRALVRREDDRVSAPIPTWGQCRGAAKERTGA